MTSHKAKKKQRAAAARNDAKKKAAAILNPLPAEPAKKASTKDAAVLEAEGLGKPAKFIEARHAVVGQKLVTWDRRQVVEFTGEVRRKTCGLYSESVPGDTIEYMFKGWSMGGDETQPFSYAPYYPFRDDAAEVARVMERFHYKVAIMERKMGKAAERRDRSTELDDAGNPIPKARKEGKPRGEVDPKTGCTLGSDSHKFGEVMLSIAPGENHRKESVEAIAKLLASRMDAPKAKALAQSWFSTLLRKRPDIYGKFKGRAKETVEA